MPPAPDPQAAPDRAALRAEMEQARHDFRRLVGDATPADLRRPSDGARWTNQQLLFNMLLGYLIVRALLVLVRVFGLLPDGASKAFARLLDSVRKPFDLINYLSSCAGARNKVEQRSATRADFPGKSTTIVNLGARCAPARSISRGCRPPVITALLLPSRPAPARGGKARSPNCPGAARYCFLRRRGAARNLCPRTLPASATPATRCPRPWAVPGAHSPVRARPYPAPHPRRPGHPARLWPRLPRLARHATIRRVLPLSPRGARASLKLLQAQVPSGLAASSAGASRHRHPEARGHRPAHPWQVSGLRRLLRAGTSPAKRSSVSGDATGSAGSSTSTIMPPELHG